MDEIWEASVRTPASSVKRLLGRHVARPAISPRFSLTVTLAAGKGTLTPPEANWLSLLWMLNAPSADTSPDSVSLLR